ncbi:Hypp4419 [Branchiostoma lanceolatum]|uniref:Hypp4419 protein n=1 Tax=Branchiostoma lanceolatum TaxID=7740 RepID=A0A8K0A9U8_BRALA|nr:Hypp4419 [Branchiostoma lanceolatum]
MGYKLAMFLGLSALLMVDQADSLRQKRMVPQEARALLDLLSILADDTAAGESATFLRGEESEEHHEGDGHDHKFLRGEEESEEHHEGDGHDHKFLRGEEESEEHHEGDGHDHKFLRGEEESLRSIMRGMVTTISS